MIQTHLAHHRTSRHGRLGVLAAAATLLASGLVAATGTGTAHADLAAVSPTIVDGVPQNYRDTRGVSLQLCLDTPLCVTPAADFIAPDGEAFFYSANADVGGITAELALEAAFVAGEPAPIVFQRTQYQAPAGVLVPGATYTITDPYGQMNCIANTDSGSRTRCRFETGGTTFASAVSGRIGPFLTAVNAPPGFLGDNATATKVTGSPIGFNKFRIQGPGLPTGACGPNCLQTDDWIVQGRMDPAVAQPAPAAVAFTSPQSLAFGSRSVTAGPSAVQAFTLLNNGNAPMTGLALSSSTPAYTVSSNCPPTLAQAAECAVSVAFDPVVRGAQFAQLNIASSAGPAAVALVGQATQAILSAPRSLRFGSSSVGSTSTRVLTLANSGDAPLSLADIGVAGPHRKSFRITGPRARRCKGGTSIAPGKSCRLAVTFHPTDGGKKVASLKMTADGARTTITLKGKGVHSGDRRGPGARIGRPRPGARGVARRTDVTVSFTERVQGVSKDTFVLINLRTGERVDAKLHRRGRSAVLDPASKLGARRTYEARLKGRQAGIRDMSGNPLNSVTWQFTTGRR
jgi:hypothetical protein